MGVKSSEGGQITFFNLGYLDALTDDKRLKLFENEKVNGKWVPKAGAEFAGLENVRLIKAKNDSYEHDKGVTSTVKLIFQDVATSELFSVEANLNTATKGFINSLAAIEDFSKPIEFWTSKYNGFWGVHVQQKGVTYPEGRKTQGWKYSEYPSYEEYQVPGKKEPDRSYHKQDTFFQKVVNELSARLQSEAVTTDVPNAPTNTNETDFPQQSTVASGLLEAIRLAKSEKVLLAIKDKILVAMSNFGELSDIEINTLAQELRSRALIMGSDSSKFSLKPESVESPFPESEPPHV